MDRISINFKVVVTSGLDPSGRSNVRGAGVALVRPYGVVFFYWVAGTQVPIILAVLSVCLKYFIIP